MRVKLLIGIHRNDPVISLHQILQHLYKQTKWDNSFIFLRLVGFVLKVNSHSSLHLWILIQPVVNILALKLQTCWLCSDVFLISVLSL